MQRVALYLRVSSRDKGQDTENQRTQMLAFIAQQPDWSITKTYEDHETASGKVERTQFKAMFADAAKHRFDILVFWSLDRFTREGAYETLRYLRQLSDLNISYRSFTEQYLDTCGMFKDAVIAILGVIAAQEIRRMSERTKAGLARARSQGKHIGRPFSKTTHIDERRFIHACSVYSIKELCDVFAVSRATVMSLRRNLRSAGKLPSGPLIPPSDTLPDPLPDPHSKSDASL